MTILERRYPGCFPISARKGTDRAERGESDPVHDIGMMPNESRPKRAL